MPKDDMSFWELFPNLAPDAISTEAGKSIPWHRDAASPRSSQTFCVSAFGSIMKNTNRNAVCTSLLSKTFPDWNKTDGSWEVELEYSDRSLLNETIGTPTQVDAVLFGPDSVVTVESKFVADAEKGLGCCSKYEKNFCNGFYGPGSDKTNPTTWCILERWDGKRTPRLYWTVGRTYFQPKVFEKQSDKMRCPFSGPNYQLMRNVLVAACLAEKRKKRRFSTLVICPRQNSKKLVEQVNEFRNNILLPQFANVVAIAFYEDYIDILRATNDQALCKVADFLALRIDAETS